jgi:hypothetical protein
VSAVIEKPQPESDLAIFQHASTEKVLRLEQIVLQAPQIDLGTTHVVHGGMCARTIFIPAGTVLTGAVTNLDNVCVLSGDITVTTNEGPRRFTGFHVLPAAKGFKRAGYAHEDTHWTTVWPTGLTDITEIEDEMTEDAAQLQTRRALGFDKRKELPNVSGN